MKQFLLYIFLIVTLTVSAHTDTVSVTVSDTTAKDCLLADTVRKDSVPKKSRNIFVRMYRFMDHIFSPPRDLKYIDVQDYYNWCAMVQLSTQLEMYQMDNEDMLLRLAPEPRTRVGPFFGWRFAFFGYNIDIKSIFFSGDDTDLRGSIYSAAFGLDMFFRRVGGNFNINRLRYGDQDLTEYLHGQSFDGVNLGMTRLSFYYIPNYKHYSHQAAFSQTHRQLISAGSIILGAQYAHNRCSVDWQSLTDMMRKYNPTASIPEGARSGLETSDEWSATVGYGYNWVFHKNWLLGSEIAGSVGYVAQDDQTEYNAKQANSNETYIEQLYNTHIALNGSLRFCLLYNNGPWYTGLQGVGFYYQHGNGVMMSRNVLATFYVFVGFNFSSFKIFKKKKKK